MTRITLHENENLFTTEQREAITRCHNKYFEAHMADSKTEEKEEREALKELRTFIPDVVMFIPNFFTGNDTLIMRGAE